MSFILRGLAAAAGVTARPVVAPARVRRSEVRDLAADTRKIRALGWSPRIPLSRSLEDTVADWRAR
jgi:nucleoside-diphosphate-sugar epimerase